MLSRALSLAAVLLLIGAFASKPALAQENLDAGKTPSQIFAATCNVCHKSPRGLLKTVSPSSLPSFLRQHYTTSPNMAGALASYLVSNGATDTRIGGDAPKGAKGTKEGAKQEAKQDARPAGAQPQQLDRFGRPIHPVTAPQEAAAPASPTEQKPEATDTQANVDHGPDGRKQSAKQKLSKRGKPGEALPKEESATGAGEPKAGDKAGEKSEPKASETAVREEGKPETGRTETGRTETGKPDAAKLPDEGRSQSAKIEQQPPPAIVRPDPVPQVTPAGSGSTGAPVQGTNAPSLAAPAPSQSAPIQAAISPPVTEMAVPLNAAPPPPPPPAVTASTPPLPRVVPAGPPSPPISQ